MGTIIRRLFARPCFRSLRRRGNFSEIDLRSRRRTGHFPTTIAPASAPSYRDPNDTVNIGAIRGHVMTANPFVLAIFPAPSLGSQVTGIVGAHVVAVDADTSAVTAGTLGGWSCDPANRPTHVDGSFDLERLPIGHNYNLYAEPLMGLALPSDFSNALTNSCSSTGAPSWQRPL